MNKTIKKSKPHHRNPENRTVFTAGLVYLASLITGLIVMGKIMGALGLALTLVIAQEFKHYI